MRIFEDRDDAYGVYVRSGRLCGSGRGFPEALAAGGVGVAEAWGGDDVSGWLDAERGRRTGEECWGGAGLADVRFKFEPFGVFGVL